MVQKIYRFVSNFMRIKLRKNEKMRLKTLLKYMRKGKVSAMRVKKKQFKSLLLNDAIKYLKKNCQSSDLFYVNYTLDGSGENFNGSVCLPNSPSKKFTTAVLVPPGIDRLPYIEAGADIVGADDLIFQIKRDTVQFDRLLTTKSMVASLNTLQECLDSKGLMPSIESGTLVEDLKISLQDFRKGNFSFSINQFGNIIVPIGHFRLSDIELAENFLAVDSVIKSLSRVKNSALDKIELTNCKKTSIQVRDPEQESNLSNLLSLIQLNLEEYILRGRIRITKFRRARTSKRINYLKARQAKIEALVKKLRAKEQDALEKAALKKARQEQEFRERIAKANLSNTNNTKSRFSFINKFNGFLVSKKVRKNQKFEENANLNSID